MILMYLLICKDTRKDEGWIAEMIFYKKRNTSFFRNHIVTVHKIFFHYVFLIWMGDPILWLVMVPPPLREVLDPAIALVNVKLLVLLH